MKIAINICFTLLFPAILLYSHEVWAEPFKVGERLQYQMSWGAVPAGESVMEVVEIVGINGRDAYHLSSKTTSNSAIASFYSLNDTIDTYVSTDDLKTLKYVALTKENERKRNETALFDYSKGEAIYSKRGKKKTIPLPPDLYDSLSSFYYLRRLTLKPGKRIVINTFTGGKIFENTIRVINREKVTVKAGSYKAIKVLLSAVESSSHAKKGESYIWFTDDNRKVPVMIKTKSAFGYITSELEKETNLHGP